MIVKVILSVPSNFIRTRIIEQYLEIIKSYWLVQNLKINDIQIIVSKDKNDNAGRSDFEKKYDRLEAKGIKNEDIFSSISSDLDE